MPWIQAKNLASRVMALCLDRLEQDWQEAFGYSPVFVETFVDRCRKGTSYRADNWIRLGETAGFSRDTQGFYKHNGSPKTLWVKPLRKDAAEILRSDTLPDDLADYELPPNPERVARHVKSVSLETLFDAFHSLTDSRAKKGRRHSLRTCLAVVACGILAGARGLSECATVGESLREPQRRALRMWRPRGQKKRVAPSHATLWRALSGIDPVEFERVILQWYNSQSDQLPAAVALDGKAVRSTLDEDNCGLHVVSAVPHDDTFFFSQTTIQCKGNEHEAVRNLIAANPKLAGTVHSLDAVHCNSESCREICGDAHAHYIMGVKENQGQLLKDIESMFTASKPADSINFEEKGHGREESRTVELLPVESRPNLPYARTAVRVHRTRRPVRNGKRGEKGQETAYFLTSLSLHKDDLSAEKAAGLIRGHWTAIENRLHHAVRFLRANSLSKARTEFLN